MQTHIADRQKMRPNTGKRKPEFRQQVLAALMMRGMTLLDYAKLRGYSNATEVSLAMNQRRRHPKARRIYADLKALVKGAQP